MVCGNDDDRVVVDPRVLQAIEEDAEQTVRVADLQEMPLERLVHEPRR